MQNQMRKEQMAAEILREEKEEEQRVAAQAEVERRDQIAADNKRRAEALRQQKLDIQRDQLRLQAERDRRETEKQGTIAGQVKWHGSVLKSSLTKFPHDSSEIP